MAKLRGHKEIVYNFFSFYHMVNFLLYFNLIFSPKSTYKNGGVCLFIICMCVLMNLIGRVVHGAWQHDSRMNLIGRAVKGVWQYDKVGISQAGFFQ